MRVGGKVFAILVLGAFLAGSVCCTPVAQAAKRKKGGSSGKIVTPYDIFEVTVTIKSGKKSQSRTVTCLEATAGQVKSANGALRFTSYSDLARSGKKAAQKALYKQLSAAGGKACKAQSATVFAPYNGQFGETEARILFNRFGFGASPEEVSAAVAKGLARTVQDMLTPVAEPGIDAAEADLRCDSYFWDDSRNESCDPRDHNALDYTGIRFGLYFRFLYSQNQFFNKLFWWLHNERVAISSRVLDGCEAWALPEYVDMVRRASLSGDYRQYMRDLNYDHLTHLVWLDGRSNHGSAPNENYAREFWELGTVGPTGRDGSPVYSSLDIAQAALAFTGWSVESFQYSIDNDDNHWVCYAAWVPKLHYPGGKTVFNGTPFAAVVEDADDMLAATFNHPRTAEHLAEDIWLEFINSKPTDGGIKELADLIRKHDYKLLPVFEKLMKSRLLFAQESRNDLIKHPLELLIGFLRSTGISWNRHNFFQYIDWWLDGLGQRPLLAPTVFGWNEERLAGEPFVLEWRNIAASILGVGNDDLEEVGYSLKNRFLTNLPTTGAAAAVVERTTGWLGLRLNGSQAAELDRYLNWELNWNNEEVRDIFDPHPDGDGDRKLRGLLLILAQLPEYRVK